MRSRALLPHDAPGFGYPHSAGGPGVAFQPSYFGATPISLHVADQDAQIEVDLHINHPVKQAKIVSGEESKKDVGVGQLTFVCSPTTDPKGWGHPNNNDFIMHFDDIKGELGTRVAVKSVSRLNWMLMTEAYRKFYDSNDSERLVKDWKYWGVQDHNDSTEPPDDEALLNFRIQGNCETPDLFAISGSTNRHGCYGSLVLVRKRMEPAPRKRMGHILDQDAADESDWSQIKSRRVGATLVGMPATATVGTRASLLSLSMSSVHMPTAGVSTVAVGSGGGASIPDLTIFDVWKTTERFVTVAGTRMDRQVFVGLYSRLHREAKKRCDDLKREKKAGLAPREHWAYIPIALADRRQPPIWIWCNDTFIGNCQPVMKIEGYTHGDVRHDTAKQHQVAALAMTFPRDNNNPHSGATSSLKVPLLKAHLMRDF